jgi:glycosyltransferase involved in cell wall biosynthesis
VTSNPAATFTMPDLADQLTTPVRNPIPYLSVIIPIYNGEADLPGLLSCLVAQTYPRDRVEYLIVDNGSTDETFTLLQNFETQEINLKVLQENTIQSSYAARNVGILAARSPFLAFTDADCRPEPDWLINLIKPFTQNPTLGWVAGEVKALESHNWLEQYADRQDTLSQKHTLANAFRPYGQTANLAIRRTCFEQIGGFRSYLTTGGDADICWRILGASGQNPERLEPSALTSTLTSALNWHFAEDAIVKHHHRSTLDDLLAQWQRYGRSNRYLHDLHGVTLQAHPKVSYYLYRALRWFLKEAPIALINRDQQALISTPIGLLCLNARWQGQKKAKLSPMAHEIISIPPKVQEKERETAQRDSVLAHNAIDGVR